MKKTILFPTDFTIESLNVVKSVLRNSDKSCRYDILLLHGMHLSDSITDLLFYSKDKIFQSLKTQEFDEACFVIKNKYDSQISSICKDIFSGFTQAAFNNYVDANKITEAYIPVNFNFNLPNRKSFNIIPYIKKSNLVLNEVEMTQHTFIPEKGRLAEVFFDGVSSNENQLAYDN